MLEIVWTSGWVEKLRKGEAQTSHSSVIKNTFGVGEGGIRQGQGHSRSIHRKVWVGGWGWGASGFVDSEFEGHSASELVPFIICGNIGSVDAAFYVHFHVGSHIQELHSHQGLCIVHLGQKKKKTQASGTLASFPRTPFCHSGATIKDLPQWDLRGTFCHSKGSTSGQCCHWQGT